MTIDEAIRTLREDPAYANLVRDAYLGRDVVDSMDRFADSAEFAEVVRLLGEDRIRGAVVLDLGAGVGIAASAFLRLGAQRVIAVEPDPSDEVGRRAMQRAGLRAEIVDAYGEALPIPDDSVDIVYARQVLHHAQDLESVMTNVARVLRRNGLFLACREHVVSDAVELATFLAGHPVNRLAGGENAFQLDQYLSAMESAGLRIEVNIGPWDSVINAFPFVRSNADLQRLPAFWLEQRFGAPGRIAARIPGIQGIVTRRITDPIPGRLHSFLAVKP